MIKTTRPELKTLCNNCIYLNKEIISCRNGGIKKMYTCKNHMKHRQKDPIRGKEHIYKLCSDINLNNKCTDYIKKPRLQVIQDALKEFIGFMFS